MSRLPRGWRGWLIVLALTMASGGCSTKGGTSPGPTRPWTVYTDPTPGVLAGDPGGLFSVEFPTGWQFRRVANHGQPPARGVTFAAPDAAARVLSNAYLNQTGGAAYPDLSVSILVVDLPGMT